MPLQVLKYIRSRTSQMAYNSALYNWSLGGDVPERLLVRPVDPWPGKAAVGQALCEGQMPPGYDFHSLHGFGFIRDLQILAHKKGCSKMARAQARTMVEDWVYQYHRWSAGAWDADIMGERIAAWISHYDFYTSNAGESQEEDYHFQEVLLESISRQACHLSRVFQHGEVQTFGQSGVGALWAAKGLLYAGLAFEGRERWVEQALECMKVDVARHIGADGMHKSCNAAVLLEALQILLDVRMALVAGNYQMPERLQYAIDKMGPALQFFRGSDKKLGLFHGGQRADVDLVDSVLAQAGVRGKGLQSLPCAGFEKISLGRSTIIFDCGAVPTCGHKGHAGPLAFEMMHGRERLFVNCGSHPSDPAWQDALRASAAHNTATLAQRNAYEIKADGHFARVATPTKAVREDGKNAILVEASHDGYKRLNGFTHRRRLYLSEDGLDLRGEDALDAEASPPGPIDVAVRFHLHPRVQVSLVRDGEEALLRLPGGIGWRFRHSAGMLALEDSVYIGAGHDPRKTKQLVIYGQIREQKAKITWALQKEGA